MWGRLAEMGVLGLPFTEDDGGMGAGPVEVSVVAEEFGRVIAPEPFVESVVIAGGLVAARGSAEQKKEILGGLSSGELVSAPPAGARPAGAGGVNESTGTLTGVKEPVLNGGRADLLVVFARGPAVPGRAGGRPRRHVVLDLRRRPRRPRRVRQDHRHPARRRRRRDRGDQRVVAAANIAYCHESLGLMESALKLTTEYLTTRKQFGMTLNRFQALTFRAADMYTSRRADPQHRQLGDHGARRRVAPRPRRSGRQPAAPSSR